MGNLARARIFHFRRVARNQSALGNTTQSVRRVLNRACRVWVYQNAKSIKMAISSRKKTAFWQFRLKAVFCLGAVCTKKQAKIIKNEKNLQNDKKFSKRVFTKRVLCGKLWEKLKRVKRKNSGFCSKNQEILQVYAQGV